MNADAELLRRYAETSSEAAFTEFVGRHIDLVYHSALRHLGGDAHGASDVTQLVFTDIARKARAIYQHPAIVSWLHKSVRYAAANLRRTAQTRRKYEQEAEAMNIFDRGEDAPSAWERLRPTIDDALHELNERDRAAVLLRFFEGRNFAEVGAALALSENGARMRVERALDKLNGLLARRGIRSSAAALAATLGSQAVATAPAGLAASVTAAALSGAAAVGVGSLTLLWSFLGASKAGLSLAAAVGLAGTVAVYQVQQARAAEVAQAGIRRDHAARAAQLAQLKARVATAEQAQSEIQAALRRARVAQAAEAAAAARRADEAAEKARQDQALRELLANDPEMRRLRIEANRAAIKADLSVGPQRLTREQLEQRADAYAARKEIQMAELVQGTNSGIITVAPNWDASQIVRQLSNALFYTDEKFTKEQVTQLETLLMRAKISGDPRLGRYGSIDWDRVLQGAEPILSPAQLQGLRGMAARGRNAQLLAAAAKESGATR